MIILIDLHSVDFIVFSGNNKIYKCYKPKHPVYLLQLLQPGASS